LILLIGTRGSAGTGGILSGIIMAIDDGYGNHCYEQNQVDIPPQQEYYQVIITAI
jgi:hypothetical protein